VDDLGSAVSRELISLTLGNGQQIQVAALIEEPVTETETESLARPSFADVVRVIEGIGEDLSALFVKLAPDEATVEFGVEITLKSGSVVSAILAQGSATAHMTLSLTWRRSSQTEQPSSPASSPA
jgi:hypothetical protein